VRKNRNEESGGAREGGREDRNLIGRYRRLGKTKREKEELETKTTKIGEETEGEEEESEAARKSSFAKEIGRWKNHVERKGRPARL